MDKTEKLLLDSEYAWLGLGDLDKIKTERIFYKVPGADDYKSAYEFLKIISKPEYLYTFCKEIMNVNLLPMQNACLQEMWNKRFPMFVGSRGAGKALITNTPIRIQNGWKLIQDIIIGDQVYGSDGKLANVTNISGKLENLNLYRITLRDGRTLDCCEDHIFKVWDKNKNRDRDKTVYSNLTIKQMFDNYFCVRKDSKSKIPKQCKEYRYAIPINKSLRDEKESDLLLHPYIVGVLLGDGSLTTNTIGITTADKEIVDRFNKFLPEGYILRKHCNKYAYGITRTNKLVPPFHQLCRTVGIYGHKSEVKFIPKEYKYTSYENKLELIRGLMDTDGYSDITTVEYYTVSNQLSKDFMDVLRSLGISCRHTIKQSWFNGRRYTDCNRIGIYTRQSIFSLSRKLTNLSHKKSKQGESRYDKTFITNIEYIGQGDGYCIAVDNEDYTYITKDYIVTHNSYLLAVLSIAKAIMVPGSKVVIVGGGFRQAKLVMEYVDKIWCNAPILRDICDNDSGIYKGNDGWKFRMNDSTILGCPLGDGSRIRGLRSTLTIADEFRSISPEIFEEVVQGFSSVSASPVEQVIMASKRRYLIDHGAWSKEQEENFLGLLSNNQTIISGTAGYDFEHFAAYHKRWKAIIRGDMEEVRRMVGDEADIKFDSKDYTIIRIPYDLIPKGYMDEKQIMKAKATIHSGIFAMEYGAVFVKDSEGFFRRTLVESCVCNAKNHVCTRLSSDIIYDAKLSGDHKKKYIIGVDPAAEKDNLAVVVLELYEDHWRIVYVWTTNAKQHAAELKEGKAIKENYYIYCCRKIRDLMQRFPTIKIAIDGQGGGKAIIEGLHDDSILEPNEQPLWLEIDKDKPKDTDFKAGNHIIEKIEFSDYDWTSKANEGLRKDFEMKFCLFPQYNGISLGLAAEHDLEAHRENDSFDSLENCMAEIEELKNELTMIVMTQTTATGRNRWDTPETKTGVGKKGRLRKDRYSALLMANMVARSMSRASSPVTFASVGGFTGDLVKEKPQGPLYSGALWYNPSINCFGLVKK